jgi:hypothetical protein
MTRSKVFIAAGLIVASAAACSDLTGANVNAEGAYSLQTVSNSSGTSHVPYQFTDSNGNTISVLGDTYSLNNDGTYNELQLLQFNGASQSKSEFGDWSQSGNVVSFTPIQSDISLTPYQATVRSSSTFGGSRTLTITSSTSTAVYSD